MSELESILSLLREENPDSIREGARMAGRAASQEAIGDLVRHIASPNIGVQEAADRALRKIGGPAVVHAVIPLLRSDEAPVRNVAMDLLRELGSTDLEALKKLLHDSDADVRIFASDILGSTGTAQAVPALCQALLNDPEVNVRYQAAVSLGQLAFAEAAPCLNKALNDEEWVQFSVIEALTKIKDASSISALIQALGKSSELVASIIVDALGEMGNIKAVPLLLKGLDSSPAALANKIVRAVINIMGERSLNLLGARDCGRLRGYLPSALADEDPDIQDAAVKAYAVLGGKDATTVLLRHAQTLDPEKDADRLVAIIEALTGVGAVDELQAAVSHENELLAQLAMNALLAVDEAAGVMELQRVFWERPRDLQRLIIMELASRAGRDSQSFFLDVLERHQDGNVLRGALLFLGRKGDPELALEKILPFFAHAYNDVKEAAIDACIALHTPKVEAFFRSLLGHTDPVQRMIGAYGLGFFDIDNNIDALSEALDDESPDVRKVAVESFGRACPMKEEYVERVEKKLADPNSDVRMAVFDTLGLCSDERFLKCLIIGLNDNDTWVRVRCAERLGEQRLVQAVEPLVGMLTDENQLVVIKAVSALGMIGGEAAFRAILPLLDAEDRDVREAAEEAVNAIQKQAGE